MGNTGMYGRSGQGRNCADGSRCAFDTPITVEITALCLVRSASSKRLASVRPVRCNSLGSSTLKLGHPWKLEPNAPEPLEERIGARAAYGLHFGHLPRLCLRRPLPAAHNHDLASKQRHDTPARPQVVPFFAALLKNIRHRRSRVLGRAILCSNLAEQRHGIIRKAVALTGKESVSGVTGGTVAGSIRRTHPCAFTLSAVTESRCAASRQRQSMRARLSWLQTRNCMQPGSAVSNFWRCGMLCPVSKSGGKLATARR